MEHGIRLYSEPELKRVIIRAINMGCHATAHSCQRELLRRQLSKSIEPLDSGQVAA